MVLTAYVSVEGFLLPELTAPLQDLVAFVRGVGLPGVDDLAHFPARPRSKQHMKTKTGIGTAAEKVPAAVQLGGATWLTIRRSFQIALKSSAQLQTVFVVLMVCFSGSFSPSSIEPQRPFESEQPPG